MPGVVAEHEMADRVDLRAHLAVDDNPPALAIQPRERNPAARRAHHQLPDLAPPRTELLADHRKRIDPAPRPIRDPLAIRRHHEPVHAVERRAEPAIRDHVDPAAHLARVGDPAAVGGEPQRVRSDRVEPRAGAVIDDDIPAASSRRAIRQPARRGQDERADRAPALAGHAVEDRDPVPADLRLERHVAALGERDR